MSGKKFGLILPEKGTQKALTFQASRNVFGNDSDSDDEKRKRPLLSRPSDLSNRKAKIVQEKALIEDQTIYQYDEIYDEVTSNKEKAKVKELKKPRYIENLIKSANKRKLENERRLERQIQKEREKEGDEFKDKEVFVTSGYKKKLEEIKLEELKEKREEYLESIGDVTKQKDLGGFYRHIYEQKLGKDKTTENNDSSSDLLKELSDEKESSLDMSKKRNYRKRKCSERNKNLSEGEIEDSDEEINRLNLEDIKQAKKPLNEKENIDADSDFSIESSDSENKDEDLKKEKKEEKIREEVTTLSSPITSETHKEETTVDKTQVFPVEDIKPKIDIWAKRTIGVVFDEALKRYYERKAVRGK